MNITKDDVQLLRGWMRSIDDGVSLKEALDRMIERIESGCDHNYQYGGAVYHSDSHPRAGTGAKSRWYEDWFYCTKCLNIEHRNPRIIGTTYQAPLPGTMPKETEFHGY